MDSPYKKSGMNNQKAAFLKNAIKSAIDEMPHSSKRPFFKLVQQESFEGSTWCSCKSDEEHKAKSQPPQPQPEDLKTIKNRTGYKGSENTFIDNFNNVFDKKMGKIREPRKGKRPIIIVPPKYIITQEDRKGLVKMGETFSYEYMRIKETDWIKFIEENKDLINEYIESSIFFSLPSSLKEGLTKTQLRRRLRMIEKRRLNG